MRFATSFTDEKPRVRWDRCWSVAASYLRLYWTDILFPASSVLFVMLRIAEASSMPTSPNIDIVLGEALILCSTTYSMGSGTAQRQPPTKTRKYLNVSLLLMRLI